MTAETARFDEAPCADCGHALRIPSYASTFTCPACGAFLAVARADGTCATSVASARKRAKSLDGNPAAHQALRDLAEESRAEYGKLLCNMRRAWLVGGIATGLLGAAGLFGMLRMELAGLARWLMLLPGAFVALGVVMIAAVPFMGDDEIAPPADAADAALRERIRQEKWALHEEESRADRERRARESERRDS